jgi:hypothetical protein
MMIGVRLLPFARAVILAACLAAGCVFASVVSRAAEPAQVGPKAQVLSHAVAVKDVCAWPNLHKLCDGSFVATIFNQPCHGEWEGDVDCWASNDGGKSWQFRGRPAPHEPATNRMNVAAGTNAEGELIVLASGWDNRTPPPPEGKPTPAPQHLAPLPIWVCRSTDHGKTWTHAEGVELPSKSRLAANHTLSDRLIPFGNIISIGEGILGACLYAYDRSANIEASCFFTSTDDGATWSVASVIGTGLNETTPLRLANGELLACARTIWVKQPPHEQRLELFRSRDNGASWTSEQSVTGPMEHPAHLLELSDGRIVLTYGDRSSPSFWSTYPNGTPGKAEFENGIEVRTSADGGKSWSPPQRIASFDGDGGYPATVELADGRLLTVFYAKRTPDHEGYQMAVVTWRLSGD